MGCRGNGEGTYSTLPSGKIRLRVGLADGTRLSFVGASKPTAPRSTGACWQISATAI